jgi:anti-sigma28 factor (negative regulator of flagellin synthesis)
MRIDPATITPITDAERRPGPAPTRNSGQPASVVSLGPDVSAAASGEVSPEISARVSRVRELLAKGDYVVDLDRLAANILDDDLAREGDR